MKTLDMIVYKFSWQGYMYDKFSLRCFVSVKCIKRNLCILVQQPISVFHVFTHSVMLTFLALIARKLRHDMKMPWELLLRHWPSVQKSGPHLNIKTVFHSHGDSHAKDKTVWDHLIFNVGIPILVRRHLYIETAPWLIFIHFCQNTIDIPYLSHKGELWGVCCEFKLW